MRHVSLELPGPPAAVVRADMNGDGLPDLVIALVYTEYDELSFEKAEGFVQMTEIVPALFDRREIRVYLASASGSYQPAAAPLPMPPSVHSLEAGMPGAPVVAVTDAGLSALRLKQEGSQPAALALEPILSETPVLAGVGTFLSGLEVMRDLDGDAVPDILFPAVTGPAVYLSDPARPAGGSPMSRLALPGDRSGQGHTLWRRYPLPQILDVNGDRRPDLVLVSGKGGEAVISILQGEGGGRFQTPRDTSLRCLESGKQDAGQAELAWFGDLDGDGRAEALTVREDTSGDDGLKEAKQPRQTLSVHPLRADLSLDPKPSVEFEALGYPSGGQWPDLGRAELKDLDGDGRKDLIMVTFDFSMFQVLHVLATKRFSMDLQFHVWAQTADGRFSEVTGQDLSEKLTLDFNDFKVGRYAQFNGDFDGDGKRDFVHLGRGRNVTIHLGQTGCRYNEKPDLTLPLEEEPGDVGLVQVRDLDGDGRSDLSVIRPRPPEGPGASTPVVLELYLSRGAS